MNNNNINNNNVENTTADNMDTAFCLRYDWTYDCKSCDPNQT